MLSNIFEIMTGICIVALLIGLITPKLALPFARNASRFKVLKVYFIGIIAFATLTYFTMSPEEKAALNNEAEPKEEEIIDSQKLVDEAILLFENNNDKMALKKVGNAIDLNHNNEEALKLRASILLMETLQLGSTYNEEYVYTGAISDTVFLKSRGFVTILDDKETIKKRQKQNNDGKEMVDNILSNLKISQYDLKQVSTLNPSIASDINENDELINSLKSLYETAYEQHAENLHKINRVIRETFKVQCEGRVRERGED